MTIIWSEHVRATLQAAGLKHGGARERVIDVLGERSCAVSALEIEDQLRASGEPIARASIYRTLDLLVDYGLVERISTGGGAAFEALHPGGHHHHLVCDQCGRLIAFNDTGLERAIDKLSERLGVRVESHEVLLRGACERCD